MLSPAHGWQKQKVLFTKSTLLLEGSNSHFWVAFFDFVFSCNRI